MPANRGGPLGVSHAEAEAHPQPCAQTHWLKPVLVLSVRWWPAPAGVGRVRDGDFLLFFKVDVSQW